VRRIHPAQAYLDGKLYYGYPAQEELLFISSQRKVMKARDLPAGAMPEDGGFNLCRFSKDGILAFTSGTDVAGYQLLRDLEAFFRQFVVFRDDNLPLLFAMWALGTYTYRLYQYFPYLILRSATKRCGKSVTLDILSHLCFNASEVLTTPTEAVLFRLPMQNGGTQIFDEVDKLGKNDEAYQNLLAVLNMGFSSMGAVARVEKVGDHYRVTNFPSYVPRALAGIKGLPDTLEDRSILVVMLRKLNTERVRKFSGWREAAEMQHLRDACYIWSLMHAADINRLYPEADLFPELKELDDRAQDIWAPLLTIAYLVDAEAEEAGEPSGYAKRLGELTRSLSAVRDEEDSTTPKLVEALFGIVKEQGKNIFLTSELLPLLQAKGFEWIKSGHIPSDLVVDQ
jgi:Protein of unknown function (DUF3631)